MAMTLTQRISTYSYIDRTAISLGTIGTSDTDAALLAQIDSLLASAGASFNARDYDGALTAYFSAESLIYAHLDPQWDPGLGPKLRPLLPRDPSLFDPLLSASSQWLNILSVPAPTSPVRPATPPAASLLASVAALHGAGLGPVSANPTATAEALSDMRLSQIYTAQGNTAASTTAVARAKSLDATIAGSFTAVAATAATAATTATVAVAPAAIAAPAIRTEPVALRAQTLSSVAISPITVAKIPPLPITLVQQKQAGLLTGIGAQSAVKSIQWAASGSPDITSIKSILYAPHAVATLLPDGLMNADSLWERSLQLPHDYFYTIPLAIAACYQALGDYANAETYYLQAAGYTYINTATEGPYVWVALAGLYSAWGDSIYKTGDRATALTIYAKVITPTSTTAPTTPLYTLAGLSVASKIAVTLLPQLATLAKSGTSGVAADNVAIAVVLLKIFGKETQINAGLDFWGNWTAAVPIWTFSYLQQVAINFTQLAMGAESQVINYWAQADQATLTKTELTNQASQANAQVNAAQQQVAASQAQAQAYQAGLTLAQTRATDAKADASEYQSLNSQVIIIQATGQQVAGGDDGDYNGVSAMASQYLAGQTISGDSETVAAATDLAANRLSQQFQVDSMNRTATEMQQAATQAQAQLTAANAQVTAASANLGVAQLQAQNAAQTVAVFNADTFTPQVWTAMGDFVEEIYDRYMDMALRAALLMQQAYNFENDTTLAYIKSSYQGVIDGLLAADALMADIQSFTDDLVNSTRGKKQFVKQSISLAGNYGYLFETQLRKTGTMTFETTLDDFDSAYPGTYEGRIERVLVQVQGIVPPTGISGTLSNGGVSYYRLPSDIATPATPSKMRIQSAETLVISDYDPTTDGVLDSTTGNQTGIFEGAGIASTWTLSLPPAVNDINYGTLTDVVLTVLYEARFDPQLVSTVISQLTSRPGYLNRERSIPLAWMYPDLFYTFVSTGTLTLTLGAPDFPMNQKSPVVTAVSLLVAMAPGTSASGITLSLTAPGKAAVSGKTDATGMVTSQGTGAAWAGATGGSALGGWTLTLTAAANPSLAPGGKLNLSALTNLVLVLDYSFTPRS
jgi:Tc toxin complex TcA C-terminal TcB-binding domain